MTLSSGGRSARTPAQALLLFVSAGVFLTAATRRLPGQQGSQSQQQPYSKSAEFQGMLRELHQPAPSPAYIATGKFPQADPALKVQVTDDAELLRLTTSQLDLSINKVIGHLDWKNLKTQDAWSITLDGACAGDQSKAQPGPSRVSGVSRQPGQNAWSIALTGPCGDQTVDLLLLTDSLAKITLSRSPPQSPANALQLHVVGDRPSFGLGERFWQAGLSGTELDVRPQDRYGEPGHNWVYVAIPFVYNAGGLGLYADTAFDTRFAFDTAGTAFDMKIANGPVPIYLFMESDPKAVLSAYTAITGRPQNPPLWTFGPWITALQGKGPVLDMARRLRVEAVPASALWVFDELDEHNNLGWPFWFGSYYGDPRTFSDILHGQGFKVLGYVHPYVRQQVLPYTNPSPQFDKGVSEKLLQTGPDGKPSGPRFEVVRTGNIDFTNPAAVDWWQSMITSAVRDQGFDGWMEDFGEWVRDSDKFAAGDGRTLSELYPLLYHKVTLRVAQALNPEVVPFSRSGAPGSQQFSPVLWGADQSPNWTRDFGLPSVVTAGITAGMSGFSTWGPDILSTGDSRELWSRWVEFGALTPVMRDHVWNKPEHSINLWSDADATALFRKYAMLHSSLLYYFATYAEEAHKTGIPIMRHTVLEYPEDMRAAGAEYQYLLGQMMLVAPVVEPGSTIRRLYLPLGEWINFWSGDSLTGGQNVAVTAGVGEIPILVKAGSILPFKPESDTASWDWSDPKLLEGSLVWKAFVSRTGSARGDFTIPNGTSAHLEQHGGDVTISGDSKTSRNYEVVIRTAQPPTAVLLDGKPLAPFAKGDTGQPATQWWWNPSSAEVHVFFHANKFRVDMSGITADQYQN